MLKFSTPSSVKTVRQFLGLSGYYRRFIKDYAKIAKPLTKLLQKKTLFEWNDDAKQSFQTLKEMLCTAPILQFPDLSQPYNITTDASGYAIGGVLSQGLIGRDRPIAYTSRVLRGPELNYEVYEKEALAILHSVGKFRSNVYGRKMTILTDHQALVWFKSADLNTRVQKWRFKLSQYDYEIIYKPGKLNSNADTLSRNPPENKNVNVITRSQIKKQNKIKSNETPEPTLEQIWPSNEPTAQSSKTKKYNKQSKNISKTRQKEKNDFEPIPEPKIPKRISKSEADKNNIEQKRGAAIPKRRVSPKTNLDATNSSDIIKKKE